MEELKKLDALTLIDERHVLIGSMTGGTLSLEDRYAKVLGISFHDGVPEELRSQFNVARNLAVYQHFCYGFAPVVQLLSYTVIEFALRIRAGDRRTGFKMLLGRAVEERWIRDGGFRHVTVARPGDPYCRSLVEILPELRNDAAHGSDQLMPHSIVHLERCADFVNQLFPRR
jgi:hypothetical protein